MNNFCRLRVPGVQALGRAWPCAPFPLLPHFQGAVARASGTPSASPGPRLTRARLGDGRPLPSSGGRACGRREWDRPQTRRASARPVQAKAARSQWGPRGQGTPRSGFGQRVLLPGRTPAARSAPIPDWKSGSPALEPPRVPCRMTGTAPTVPQVPESRRAATSPRGWERRMLSKTLPFGASNVYAGERTRGWLAPSRQSRADMPTRGRGPEPSITG